MAFMEKKKDKFQGTQDKGKVPDGEHLVRVRGMRRTELKSGAGIVNIDLEIVRSNVNGLEVSDFAGREFDVRYFFPIDNDELFDKTFERFIQRDLKHIMGKVPEGDFTSDDVFALWCKTIIGRGAWVNRTTSEKADKDGNPYVNVYFNKGADVPQKSGARPSQPAQQANPQSTSNNSTPLEDDDIPF
jgi:hypothetical protein